MKNLNIKYKIKIEYDTTCTQQNDQVNSPHYIWIGGITISIELHKAIIIRKII